MFNALSISGSALQAQRTRMDTIADNIANANTVRNVDGKAVPYRRRFVMFAPGQGDDPTRPGVHVQKIGLDESPFPKMYDPGNPLHDKDGNVAQPNVDLAVEFVNALEASRAYEANVTTMDVTKAMINSALRIIA